jgi:putative oxidoreductase
MSSSLHRFRRIDRVIIHFMSEAALPLLRVSLAINYIWFGALKIFGVSPVSDLVSKTVPFLPKKFFVPFLGVWEVTIGIALLFRIALRPVLFLFFLQLAGTFLTFIIRPQDTFKKGNPLLLTEQGEFVIKNLILLSAGIAVGSTVQRKREEVPESDGAIAH